MITLGATCGKCGESITIDKEDYEADPEYAYWYGEDAYCQTVSYDTPHSVGDDGYKVVADDGYRKVNLSAEARAVLAGMLAPSDEVNSDGIYAGDKTWAELRTAFPQGEFTAWLDSLVERDESGLTPEGIGYDEEAGM